MDERNYAVYVKTEVSENHVLVCPSVLARKLCRKSFCKSTEVPEKLGVCVKHVLPCCLCMSRDCIVVGGGFALCLDLVGPCPFVGLFALNSLRACRPPFVVGLSDDELGRLFRGCLRVPL